MPMSSSAPHTVPATAPAPEQELRVLPRCALGPSPSQPPPCCPVVTHLADPGVLWKGVNAVRPDGPDAGKRPENLRGGAR